ncbi:MAG: hypothetical protein V1859_09290 [archaeon]
MKANKKRGDIPVYVIFSIVITIAGIALVFALAGSTSGVGKQVYCKTLYDQSKKSDAFCEEYLNLASSRLVAKQNHIDFFLDRRKKVDYLLTPSNLFSGKASLVLPSASKIESAKMKIALKPFTIQTFNTGKTSEKLVIPPNRQTNPAPKVVINSPPLQSKVTHSKLEIYGMSQPTRADITYVIDTSSSMLNEWNTLCTNLGDVKSTLEEKGLDVKFTVYALGASGAQGTCVDVTLDRSMLSSIIALTAPGPTYGCGSDYCKDPYDDYDEAWAVGTSWIALNHPWRSGNDIKRIVIPIGDSDPTGGGPTRRNGDNYFDARFSGTEDTNLGVVPIGAIQQAISFCTRPWPDWTYVLPIEGDEEGNAEGYGVGSSDCNFPSTCYDIQTWMQSMIDATTTKLLSPVPFENRDTILESILEIMTTPYPKNIEIYINGAKVWNFIPELNDKNSQKVIDTKEFNDAMQNSCRGQPCVLTIVSDEGTILLNRLKIEYYSDPSSPIILNINGNPITLSQLRYDNPVIELDFTNELTSAMQSCNRNLKDCQVLIELKATQDVSIAISDINVSYEYYMLEDELFEKILSCYKDSNLGASKKNFLCEEFVVPTNYIYNYPITEKTITDMLIDKNLCHLISNNLVNGIAAACGDYDSILFTQDIYNTRNILIEYNGESGQVVVS